MKTINIEIRSAEGGTDSKMLVSDMEKVYLKSCSIYGYKSEVKERREGFVSI
jgi:protein subunit release factor A